MAALTCFLDASVVPKKDALVMSFADATGVFNARQLCTCVPANGDAGDYTSYALLFIVGMAVIAEVG